MSICVSYDILKILTLRRDCPRKFITFLENVVKLFLMYNVFFVDSIFLIILLNYATLVENLCINS